MDNTSKTVRKMLQTIVWIISVLLIISLGIGIPYFIHLQKESNKTIEAQSIINDVFTRLDNLSTPLSANDRIFINRKHAAYLWERFRVGKNNFFGTNYNGWSSGSTYYEYAFLQYKLGYPQDFLEGIQENLKSKSMKAYNCAIIKSAFEMGMFDDCSTMLELYKNQIEKSKRYTLDEIDYQTIFTAEKVGLFTLAKEIIEHREKTDDKDILQIYKAHALLMTDERNEALSLYRSQTGDYKNVIQQDFAVFRWLGFPDTEISAIEKELHLDRIATYTLPADDANADIAKPFTGKWQHEENGRRIQWEIKNKYNLCRYLFQTQRNEKEWLDDDIAVTRYRFKQTDGKTIIEEYNARTNVLSHSEIALINEQELQVTEIDNGSGKPENKIKVYKRMK